MKDVKRGPVLNRENQFDASHKLVMRELDTYCSSHTDLLYEVSPIVGVVSGLKPASLIRDIAELRSYVVRLGMFCERSKNGRVSIAQDPQVAQQLSRAHSRLAFCDDPLEKEGIHREIGLLLGYPTTATDYFLERRPTVFAPIELQCPAIVPYELVSTDREAMCQIVLSNGNWQQELDQYVLPLEEAMKAYAPLTYAEILRRTREKKAINQIRRLIRLKFEQGYAGSLGVAEQIVYR